MEMSNCLKISYPFPVSENLYQTPSAEPCLPVAEHEEKTNVPPVVIEHLKGTRPWVKFCSLSGYVSALFIIIIDLVMVRLMLAHYPLRQTIMLAIFYLILAGLFIIPSLRLSYYERSITRLVVSNRLEDLELAIAHQRAFWKQMGIMILIILLLYLVTVAFSAIVLLSSR